MISQKNNKGIAVKSQVVAPRTLKSEAMNSSEKIGFYQVFGIHQRDSGITLKSSLGE